METIAAKVGVSAAAVYRHYSGEYDLFRRAVLALSQQLVDCTDPEPDESDAAGTLDRLVDALIDATLDNRDSGRHGAYRLGRRNYGVRDLPVLLRQVRDPRDRIAPGGRPGLPTAARPSVTPTQARFLVHAAMALVVDLGRMGNDEEQSAYTQACVRKLIEVTLFGPPASRADAVPRQPPGRRRRVSSSPSRAARR
jgi:AcrR family transcriptional regulator